MPVGAIRDFVRAFDVSECVVHAEGDEDVVAKEAVKWLVGDLCDYFSQKDIAGVAVGPSCAWLKLRGGLPKEGEHSGIADLVLSFKSHLWGGPRQQVFVVGQARCVAEQVANGDGSSIPGEIGEDVSEASVVGE